MVSRPGTFPAREADPFAAASSLDDKKRVVLDHLVEQGFRVVGDRIVGAIPRTKQDIRALHALAVSDSRKRGQKALAHLEDRFLTSLAGRVDLEAIRPDLVLVDRSSSYEGRLWRWATLHWSIPVSAGYGRRLRYLIVDRGNDDALIGVAGLADPVFALGDRDRFIGWDSEMRRERLTNVMDAYALGAVPPYSALLGGKLAALLVQSTQVRQHFSAKYGETTTLIGQRPGASALAAITTASALGRSSVYNRLTLPDGSNALTAVGYTRGSGDFHFGGDVYSLLAELALSSSGQDTERHPRWTSGTFRNRREVIHKGLAALGLDGTALRIHGIERQLFIGELADNSAAWLAGKSSTLNWRTLSVQALSRWWLERWAIPRAARYPDWPRFNRASWRLY